jgi:lantibiotic modifying enzyme
MSFDSRGAELITAAISIGDEILDRRTEHPWGPDWLQPVGYDTQLDPLRLEPAGRFLYNGRTGIALFLAALTRVTGDGKYGEVALRAIASLRRKLILRAADPASLSHLPIGGLIGLSSILYGFLKIGSFLGDESLIEEAHRITGFLTPERIAQDERVWVQVGSAGALLCMFALEGEAPGANRSGITPREIARQCGEQILRQRTSFDGRPPAWRLSAGKPPLIGFSYGAAGVSYALLRLYAATGEERFLAGARDGLGFIRSLFSEEFGAWLDIRTLFRAGYAGPTAGDWKDWWKSGGQSENELAPLSAPQDPPPVPRPPRRFLGMWCHGAAGILLGRLAALDVLRDDEAEREIAIGLDLIRSCSEPETFAEEERDDLCCGHAGRIAVLQYAADRLGDESLREEARELAGRVLARARSRGGFRFSSARGSDLYAPSLFQGAAGIGYTLLRLARPAELPCLLTLD